MPASDRLVCRWPCERTHSQSRGRWFRLWRPASLRDDGVIRVYKGAANPAARQISITAPQFDRRCIKLGGELSAIAVPRLTDCLEQALADGVQQTVVDLSALDSLDLTAVGALLVAHLRAADDHRELLLIRGPAAVQHLIDRVNGPFCYLPPTQRI